MHLGKKEDKMNVLNQEVNDNFAIYHGDSVELLKGMPDNSVGFMLTSTPFAELYYYNDSDRDMGNVKDYDEFFEGLKYMVPEIYRTLKPGRCIALHCMDIPAMIERDGYLGLKPFPDDLRALFMDCGYIYHDKITIYKDPLIEALRTHAICLAYGQLEKDSSICRTGIPDTIVVMRKPGENKEKISHYDENRIGEYEYFGYNDPDGSRYTNSETGESYTVRRGMKKYNHIVWQHYASPIWTDIRQTGTLQKSSARGEKDEKHICPLQLDTIARCILLWSNTGDIVLDPFVGIGSVVYQAILIDRRGIGMDLKESYFKQAVLNCHHAVEIKSQKLLF
jgi:DNA modification methylase